MLKQFTTTKVVEFHSGTVIGLSEALATKRAANLKSLGDGLYQVLRTVQLKAGELVGMTERPKGYETSLRADDDAPAAPPATLPQIKPKRRAVSRIK